MYLVVSTWEALPGNEQAMDEEALHVQAALRREPGVVLVEAFKSDGRHIVVHGYEDEAAYSRVQNDTESGFAKEFRARNVDGRARWLGSLKGETFPRI